MVNYVVVFLIKLLHKDIFQIHFYIKDIKLNLESIILLFLLNQLLHILIKGNDII